jgi:hypothetical protein
MEQLMAMSQIPPEGIAEAQLAKRLGMPAPEAAGIKVTLLRRRLIRRDPPGRARVTSRLVLTERGRRANLWLEHLQLSMSPTLFGVAGPPAQEDTAEQRSSEPTDSIQAPSRGSGRSLLFWRARSEMADPFATQPGMDESTFERGLLNVWLGTGVFIVAAAVGITGQSAVHSLTALGIGTLVALVFLSRAAILLFRAHRSVARLRRSLRRLEPARRARRLHWPRNRSGRAVQ